MIRPSTPTDAKAVVPLIDIVFEEMAIPQLQRLTKQDLYPIFEKAFLLPEYRYGYANTFVHENAAGGVDGILVGYPHEQELKIDEPFLPFWPALGLDQELFPDVETYAGEWYVDTLAVAPEAQGQGVGTALLTGIEAGLRKQGEALLSLNVDQENPGAERLYRRLGYEKTGELMIGTHRYNHMVKPL